MVRKLGSKYRYSLHLPTGPARSRWEPGIVGMLRDLGVLNAMLSRLETEGVIRRDIRGRRTFSITLAKRMA